MRVKLCNDMSLFSDLTPNTRYIFTVRSVNKDWVSRPSSFTKIVTTRIDGGVDRPGPVGDTVPSLREIRSKLTSATVRLVSVEALTSTSLRVTWRILIDDRTLEGVYVRYRPLDSRKSLPIGALSVETIHFPSRGSTFASYENIEETNMLSGTGRLVSIPTSYVISNLRPATSYEVFIVPFYRNIQGQPSSAMRRTTLPAPILATPTGLHYRSINSTLVRVGWDPLPSTMDVGGRLQGYNLQVKILFRCNS